jgi:hypothetical protein
MEVEVPGGTPAEVFVPASSAGDVSLAVGQARFIRAEGGYCIYDVDPGRDAQNVVFSVQ